MSTANVLRASGIAELLKTYPNQRFVDTLTSIAISGARIGFEGSRIGRTQRPNHSSAYDHPEIVTESIQSEIQKGRVRHVQNLPPNYFCSLLRNGIVVGF